jgi:hypothetical protein
MFKLTLKLTAGALLAVPALVSATPIYVEYDGSINTCSCGDSGYAPGDRFSGWLKIDTDLAPPDRFASEAGPGDQIHSNFWMPGGPDFVSGTGFPGTVSPNHTEFDVDGVQVIDDDDRFSYQGYAIWDYSNDGKGGSTVFELQIASEDRVDDFIHGKGLAQSFDTANLNGAIRFIARVAHDVMGEARYGFDLVIDRFSVTPGTCRAG